MIIELIHLNLHRWGDLRMGQCRIGPLLAGAKSRPAQHTFLLLYLSDPDLEVAPTKQVTHGGFLAGTETHPNKARPTHVKRMKSLTCAIGSLNWAGREPPADKQNG